MNDQLLGLSFANRRRMHNHFDMNIWCYIIMINTLINLNIEYYKIGEEQGSDMWLLISLVKVDIIV